jgi:hypothetical protein
MAAQVTSGVARQLQLKRAARVAGEAFAFVDHEASSARTGPGSGALLVWTALGMVAAAALWLGL